MTIFPYFFTFLYVYVRKSVCVQKHVGGVGVMYAHTYKYIRKSEVKFRCGSSDAIHLFSVCIGVGGGGFPLA